jgi:hypothetical protein
MDNYDLIMMVISKHFKIPSVAISPGVPPSTEKCVDEMKMKKNGSHQIRSFHQRTAFIRLPSLSSLLHSSYP